MTWTYSGDPSSGDVDAVRSLIGDTDESRPLLTDEQIQWQVNRLKKAYNDITMTAAFCADMVAASFSGEITISADGVSVSGNQLRQQYSDLAAQLRASYKALVAAGAGGPDVTVMVGGLVDDPSIPALTFGVGMHDNVEAGRQDYGGRERWGDGFDAPYGNYGA